MGLVRALALAARKFRRRIHLRRRRGNSARLVRRLGRSEPPSGPDGTAPGPGARTALGGQELTARSVCELAREGGGGGRPGLIFMRTAEPCACEFVLIRIAPDPIRNEAVNVGVALFQPEAGGFVGVRISPGWNHVRRLAPAFDPGDLEGLEAALLERFQAAAPAWRSREYFLQLGLESFSHCLQISPPTAVLTRDPAQELDRLYHAYAAPAAEPEAIVAAGARQLIRNHLNRVFREERIYDKLYRGARASLWLREPDRFRFHYHYQPRPEDTC